MTLQAREVTDIVEAMAPLHLAASWDNSGWQIGSSQAEISGVLLALDLTRSVLEEAGGQGLNLIITHHPFFFRPLQRLNLESPHGQLVAGAIRQGINVYAAHTNLDQVEEGVSMALAKRLELEEVEFLDPVAPQTYKLVVFVPVEQAEAVKQAMGEAGAGAIGNYEMCFWQTAGTGQFRPREGATPSIGQIGEVSKVEEVRVEGVVEKPQLSAVLRAMQAAHPYEEVAYDLYPLANGVRRTGWGAIGNLEKPMTTGALIDHVRRSLNVPSLRVVRGSENLHRTLAVCGGAGASFLSKAAQRSTAYVTADVKYHEAQEAAELGLTLMDAGHYYTERPVLDVLATKLRDKVEVPVIVSEIVTSPFEA